MNLNLKDKVVMITGSTGGVGEALVRAFAAEGCKLAISSTRQSKLDAMLPNIDIAPDHLLTFVDQGYGGENGGPLWSPGRSGEQCRL